MVLILYIQPRKSFYSKTILAYQHHHTAKTLLAAAPCLFPQKHATAPHTSPFTWTWHRTVKPVKPQQNNSYHTCNKSTSYHHRPGMYQTVELWLSLSWVYLARDSVVKSKSNKPPKCADIAQFVCGFFWFWGVFCLGKVAEMMQDTHVSAINYSWTLAKPLPRTATIQSCAISCSRWVLKFSFSQSRIPKKRFVEYG